MYVSGFIGVARCRHGIEKDRIVLNRRLIHYFTRCSVIIIMKKDAWELFQVGLDENYYHAYRMSETRNIYLENCRP